jgi:hypothetical protein
MSHVMKTQLSCIHALPEADQPPSFQDHTSLYLAHSTLYLTPDSAMPPSISASYAPPLPATQIFVSYYSPQLMHHSPPSFLLLPSLDKPLHHLTQNSSLYLRHPQRRESSGTQDCKRNVFFLNLSVVYVYGFEAVSSFGERRGGERS